MTDVHTTTPGPTVASAADAPGWLGVLAPVIDWLDRMPVWVWIAFTAGHFLITAALVLLAALRRRAGSSNGLFTAAITATVLFLFAVLVGSFRGLVAFGRDTLHWTGGWEYLVPATLDGVAVACALLTLAAVLKQRPADTAYRVVWLATLASAAINYAHEANAPTGSALGGAYLGLLSLLGMLLLHIVLGLVGDTGRPVVVRVNPVFALRWITWPSNTAAAWLAWRNHPPRPLPANPTEEEIAWYGSVRHAVTHLETVRRAKRIARYRLDVPAGAGPAAGWARVWPWLRVRQLTAAMTDQAASATAQLDAVRRELATVAGQLAEVTELFETASGELDRTTDRLRIAEERAAVAEQARAAAETAADATRREADAKVQAIEVDAARRITAAEQTATVLADQLDRERAAVAAAQASATASRPVSARAGTAHGTATSSPPASADRSSGERSGGRSATRSPSSPPWSGQQERAFELRDADPKKWTFDAIAVEVGAGESSVRRWFDHRRKYLASLAAVPTTPIPSPSVPVTAGTNGTPVTR